MFIDDTLGGEVVESQKGQDALFISPGSELTAASAPEFKRSVRARLDPACKRLEIDLSKVTFVESAGLGALLGLRTLMRERGGGISLVQPSAFVRQMLELTRLQDVFEIVVRN
jgi:anti-sigma B factor antagonist